GLNQVTGSLACCRGDRGDRRPDERPGDDRGGQAVEGQEGLDPGGVDLAAEQIGDHAGDGDEHRPDQCRLGHVADTHDGSFPQLRGALSDTPFGDVTVEGLGQGAGVAATDVVVGVATVDEVAAGVGDGTGP